VTPGSTIDDEEGVEVPTEDDDLEDLDDELEEEEDDDAGDD
jgi:hypothetical protein